MMPFRRSLASVGSLALLACSAVDNEPVQAGDPDVFEAKIIAAFQAPDPAAAMLGLIFTDGMTEWEVDLAQTTAGRLGGQTSVTGIEFEPLPEDFRAVNVRDGVEYTAVPEPKGLIRFEREDGATSGIPYGITDDLYWIVGTRRQVVDPDAPKDKVLQIMALGIASPPAEFDGWCDVRYSNGEIARLRLDDQDVGNQTRIVRGQEIVACELTNLGGRGSLVLRLQVDRDVIFEGRAEPPKTVVSYLEGASSSSAAQGSAGQGSATLRPPTDPGGSSQADLSFPYVVEPACPGEGCMYDGWLACGAVPVYASRDDAAELLATLEAAKTFEVLTGAVVVESPGIVAVTRPSRPIPFLAGEDIFQPGDTLFVLDYLGEGFYNTWFQGAFFETEQFWPGPDFFPADDFEYGGSVVEEVRSSFWVQIRSGDRDEGWVDVSNATVAAPNALDPDPPACR